MMETERYIPHDEAPKEAIVQRVDAVAREAQEKFGGKGEHEWPSFFDSDFQLIGINSKICGADSLVSSFQNLNNHSHSSVRSESAMDID